MNKKRIWRKYRRREHRRGYGEQFRWCGREGGGVQIHYFIRWEQCLTYYLCRIWFWNDKFRFWILREHFVVLWFVEGYSRLWVPGIAFQVLFSCGLTLFDFVNHSMVSVAGYWISMLLISIVLVIKDKPLSIFFEKVKNKL